MDDSYKKQYQERFKKQERSFALKHEFKPILLEYFKDESGWRIEIVNTASQLIQRERLGEGLTNRQLVEMTKAVFHKLDPKVQKAAKKMEMETNEKPSIIDILKSKLW